MKSLVEFAGYVIRMVHGDWEKEILPLLVHDQDRVSRLYAANLLHFYLISVKHFVKTIESKKEGTLEELIQCELAVGRVEQVRHWFMIENQGKDNLVDAEDDPLD